VQYPITSHSCLKKPLEVFALFLTLLTCIEVGICIPVIYHVLGYDALGTRSAILVLICGFVSQIPKRFVFRPRPWMLGRARKLRKDKTSSFPSRAVTCGVVYGFIFGEMFDLSRPTWEVIVPCAIILGALAALSRIFLGAHYPSDCLVAYFVGLLACTGGVLVLLVEEAACGNCSENECYATENTRALSFSNFGTIEPYSIVILTVFFSFVVFILMLNPLKFWGKTAHVAGVLLACVTFRLTFLCPTFADHRYALPHPQDVTVGAVFLALGVCLVTTAIGKKAKKMPFRKGFIVYLFLYFVTLITLSSWRLHYLR